MLNDSYIKARVTNMTKVNEMHHLHPGLNPLYMSKTRLIMMFCNRRCCSICVFFA